MLSARLAACSAAALLIGVSGGMLESVVPAGAAVTAAALANGWATYTPGATAPVTFDVLSLVTGGASNVDATSLTVVTAPPFADATATVTAPGSIRLTPVATASGTFSLTFGLCAPGVPTWTSSDPTCTRARLTYAQPVPQTMGYHFTLVGPRSGREALDLAVDAPSVAPATGVFTMTVALAPITVPLQETGFGVSYVDAIATMLPVPAGLTYVPTSAVAVGGTARIDRGTTVTYCTAPAAGCTGTDSGDYHTTPPYLELRTGTTSTGGIAGGASATLPTIRAEFKATGPVGTTVMLRATQFRMNVSTVLPATVNAFPSANTGANPPPYEAPAVLSTTTIVASAPAPSITGFAPVTGRTPGGATVTITGTNLTGTTAVTFGATAATTVAVAPTGGSLTVVVPAHPAGAVKLSVTTAGGTVAASGTFTFVPATRAALSVATTSLATGTEGSVYSATLAATGATAPYTWTATGLPGGLHLSRTGLIAGTPTTQGVFTVHVAVAGAGAGAPTATAALTLTVIGPPPSVSTTYLPAGSEGAAYSATLAATGGAAPYTWTATGLPGGLHLSRTGLIAGTPTTPGASTVSFTVTATTGRRASSTFTLSVTGALAITTASLPTAVVGFPYSSTLSASGGLPPYSWAASGLPAGLAANTTGSITGTPVATGTSKVTITLTGQTGQTASTTLTLATTTTPVPATGGYWTPTAGGGMLAFGPGAQLAGSMNDQRLNAPVVGMAAAPTGDSYWEVAGDGGVFAFGPGAAFYGSMGGTTLNGPVVGIAAAPTGKGYWEVAGDGGVFAFGRAQFYGSKIGR
ncbi:MAG: putative Ig domain-containing protein, partial [Acidimicrobiales bacterium]